jgi:hypothetical protein
VSDKDARAAEIAIANANETAQVAKRDGDAVAIAKAVKTSVRLIPFPVSLPK